MREVYPMPQFSSFVRRYRFAAGVIVVPAAFFLALFFIFPTFAQNNPVISDSTAADTVKVKPDSTAERGNPRICITMDKGGKIIIELYPDEAPIATERILTLVKDGFYDDLPFHRVESYLVQTGKKENDFTPIEGEMFGQSKRHKEGMVGMARLLSDYDSATTHFYICKEMVSKFNFEFTLFGCVVEGMEIVHKMKKGDKIKTISMLQ